MLGPDDKPEVWFEAVRIILGRTRKRRKIARGLAWYKGPPAWVSAAGSATIGTPGTTPPGGGGGGGGGIAASVPASISVQ